MKFRDVQLINSGKTSDEKLEQNRYLMFYWENIRNLFCMNLPNDLELLGISKLNIQLGQYQGASFLEPDNRGIAEFRRSDFSFDDFRDLTEVNKDRVSLGYIEDSLISICEEFDVSSNVKRQIRSAAKSVIECGFESERIHLKTSKWHKSKKVRAITKLRFKKGGVDAVLEIMDKSGAVISSQLIIESRIWEAVWFDLWKGTWKKNIFVIEGRTGETFYEIECST